VNIGLYPKIAYEGMRKNGKLYIPYCITCILMVAIYYIVHFLAFSGVLIGIPGASTAVQMLGFGVYVITIFSAIFLFYTQSTLIKGRKKEFGLYSVLGMNKNNLGMIIFYETIMTWIAAIFGGLILGIGMSKVAELGFTRMIAAPVNYDFRISTDSVLHTIGTFTVIFLLIWLNTIRQIKFSSAIELVRSEKAGEKPPKANWFIGILGVIVLGAGYVLAIRIQQPISALFGFFIAVVLVIVGTYLVLIAGSVLLCRILQKNKDYYYKTNHFVSVSSMAYRMKRNGAGLASICILLTIVLVILSSTSVLFNNSEYCLTVRYPNEIGAFACTYGYDENLTDLGERLDDILYEAAEAHGATVTNNKTYYTYSICGYLENDVLQVTLDSLSDMTFIDYDKVAQIQFIDVGLYNRVFGYNETVEPGKAIVGTANDITLGDTLIIGDSTFEVSKRIDDRIDEIDPASKIAVSPTIYMIVDDVEEVAQNYIQYQDYNGEPMLAWYWYCRFDTGLDVDGQIAVANDLSAILNEELGPLNFTNYYCDSHENQRTDFLSTFGGLMFLGILLSTIFLVSCVLIIYYKQISEGFEDKSRFEIMQKVGMTREDIKKSINSQMLTVFLIPIVFACAHLFMALPIIHKLLMLMGFMNMPMLVATASVCVVICAVFYAAIYKVTSNAYYKIVS